jgi:anti-sigma factor RsiW
LWQRCCAAEASEDEAEWSLDLAGFADGRLDEDEHQRVAARLALGAAEAADVAAARALAAAFPPPVSEAVVARAAALVSAQVVPLRPRQRLAVLWAGTARWGSLAAAVALASWLGFNLGSAATGALTQGGSDTASLGELLDPGSTTLHALENGRS